MGMLDDYVKALQNVPLQEAIPGGAGTTPQGDPTLLSNMITGTLGLPKQALEAAQHDVTHNIGNPNASRETVGPAFEIAKALMGMGTPFAETNAAGIFGGKLAKTADLSALKRAEELTALGKSPEEVRMSTGWHQGASDGKWRFEIPDNKSNLNYLPDVEGDTAIGTVPNLFNHPELMKAYPQLKDYNMNLTLDKNPRAPNGSGLFAGTTASVNAPNYQTGRSVALHELQHAVQGIEGFSEGATPNFYASKVEKSLGPENFDYDKIQQQAFDAYLRNAGEVEARNVQTRRDYSPLERLTKSPLDTEDFGIKDQNIIDPSTSMIQYLRDSRFK